MIRCSLYDKTKGTERLRSPALSEGGINWNFRGSSYDFKVERTARCYCVPFAVFALLLRGVYRILGWKKTGGIGVYREAVVSRRILKTIGYAIFGLLVQRINVLMLFQRVHIYSVWPGIFHGLRIFSAFYCSGLSSW